MNKYVKIAIAVTATAAVGYVAYRAYKSSKKFLDDLDIDPINDGWDALRDDLDDPEFESTLGEPGFQAEPVEGDPILASAKDILKEMNAKKEEMATELFRKPPTQEDDEYVNYASQYRTEETVTPMNINLFEQAEPDEIGTIFFITEEEYEKDHLGSDEIWGKVVLNYFIPDDILTDDDDNIIKEEEVIGAGMIKETLDHGNPDAEAFYVRNTNFDTDFKIMLINESVLGDVGE